MELMVNSLITAKLPFIHIVEFLQYYIVGLVKREDAHVLLAILASIRLNAKIRIDKKQRFNR